VTPERAREVLALPLLTDSEVLEAPEGLYAIARPTIGLASPGGVIRAQKPAAAAGPVDTYLPNEYDVEADCFVAGRARLVARVCPANWPVDKRPKPHMVEQLVERQDGKIVVYDYVLFEIDEAATAALRERANRPYVHRV